MGQIASSENILYSYADLITANVKILREIEMMLDKWVIHVSLY